jgi:Na+/melibiose symporter-like transporter
MLAVALLTTGGCGYYYVQAVLDEDRALSRAAAFAFFVFGVVSAVFIRRLL